MIAFGLLPGDSSPSSYATHCGRDKGIATDPRETSPSMSSVDIPDRADAIFVGAGHNSLVAAAYLARAGIRPLIMEAKDTIGGGLMTRDVTLPGFRHNLGAYFSRWTPTYRIWQDLNLDRYGLQSVVPDVQCAVVLKYGGRLVAWSSVERTVEEIRRVSPKDAETYASFYRRAQFLAREIIGPMRFSHPLPPDERLSLLNSSMIGRRYLEIEKQAPLALVRDLFQHEAVRALVLFNVATSAYLPLLNTPGTGYIVPLAILASHSTAVHPGGGAQAAQALAAAVQASGGRIICGVPISRVLVENGRARGIMLRDGRIVFVNKFICSSLPAPMTFGQLIERQHLDATFLDEVERYHWQEDSIFGVHLALREAPRYRSFDPGDPVHHALNICIGADTSNDWERQCEAILGRRTPQICFQAGVPTQFDSTLAPPGAACAFAWQLVPRELVTTGPVIWDGPAGKTLAARMIDLWRDHAPNLAEAELARFNFTPLDTARAVPSMVLGDRHHGSYHPDNFDFNRPHPALSQYATPIDGLYQCGSSCYPGGSFTGQPGFNAATRIAKDYGLDPWWGPVPASEALRRLPAAVLR